MEIKLFILLTIHLFMTAFHVNAQIGGYYTVDKHAFFNQTSADQPSVSTSWGFDAQVHGSSNDIAAATFAPPGVPQMQLGSYGILYYHSDSYASQAALDSAFSDGTYTFSATAGNKWLATATVTIPENMYPAIPYFDGTTFANLRSYDPSQPFTFTWNNPIPNESVNFQFTDFFIMEVSTSYTRQFTEYSSSVFEFGSSNVPENTLLPDTTYRATLVFTNGIITQNAGFGDYVSEATNTYYTQISFKTVPEPSGLTLVGIGLFVFALFVPKSRKNG